jgi:hypothetical protein
MVRKIMDVIMPIAVGIWIGIGISNWPKIATYVNFAAMVTIFICACGLSWRLSKEKHKRSIKDNKDEV